ncbi:MAG: DNA-processing protein DprA [Syntrophomonadaceae bacterium]|nr:DNA-processing protein DprA [Syntrophomonadaceae bacterium]
MDRLEKAILCTIHSIPGLGNRSLWKIKDAFGSFQNFFEADSKTLYASFLKPEIIDNLLKKRKSSPEILMKEYRSEDIEMVTWDESLYPQNLRNISNPPVILYYRGDIEVAGQSCLAVVGSRAASVYGRNVARKLARELAESGIVIVSGMARGIDSEAHRGALEVGKTIAVMGSALNVVYPPENRKLFQEIIASGAVISEFPLHTHPEPANFPLRNRIISGLCRGVVVVEGKEKSGALITADFALEQGRDVFAVPGPINSKTSAGPNNLIKQGAILITGIEDILEEYYDINRTPGTLKQDRLLLLDDNEKLVLELLANESLHFDELIQNSGLEIGTLSTVLFKLEFEGIIKSLPGNYYVRI